MASPKKGRPRTSPALIAGGGVALLLLVATVVLLALTLSELRTARVNIEDQDAKAMELLEVTEPALDDVPALVEAAEPVLQRAAPLFGRLLAEGPELEAVVDRLPLVLAAVQGLANEGIPLARALIASDLPALVGELRAADLAALSQNLQAADLPALIAEIQEADLPQLLRILEGSELSATLSDVRALVNETELRRLPRRAVKSTRRLHDLLKVQRDAYDVLRTSLNVQLEIRDRVRSIDERLGGLVTPP